MTKNEVFNSHIFKAVAAVALAIMVASGVALAVSKQADSGIGGVVSASVLRADHVNAIYEWRDFRDFKSDDYRKSLQNLRHQGFNEIYLSVNAYVDITDSGDVRTVETQNQYLQKLSSYVALCKSEGFKVEALAGGTDWSTPDKQYLNQYAIKGVEQFNVKYPHQALDSLQFDIEAYNLPEYHNNKAQVLEDYLSTVSTIYGWSRQAQVNNSPVSVGFTVPFWFDNDTSNVEAIPFNGKTKYPLYQLVDIADKNSGFIVVMAYRNQLEGSDGILSHIKNEITYTGAKNNTQLFIAQETGDITPATITYHASGRSKLIKNINSLYDRYPNQKSFKGIIVNDFQSLDQLKQ